MPAHNDAPFVGAAIESLLAQRFGDFILHIADDASTDGTEDICRSFARDDHRVVYERHDENLGIARNMAFLRDSATTEFFAWAADDDLWHADFLGTLHDGLISNRSAVVAFCPVRLIDEHGRALGDKCNDFSAPSPRERLAKLTAAWDDSFGYGLFRRSATIGMRFPIWRGPNRGSSHHVIYPSLYYALSKGDFVLCGDEPLWYNRIKTSDRMNYNRHLHQDHFIRGVSVIALRKANVWLECVAQTKEAGGVALAAHTAPSLALRLLGDVVRTTVAKAARVLRRDARLW